MKAGLVRSGDVPSCGNAKSSRKGDASSKS